MSGAMKAGKPPKQGSVTWDEMFTAAEPYFTAGSFVWGGLQYFEEQTQTELLRSVKDLLKNISKQIAEMGRRLEERIDDADLSRLWGLVYGSIELLEEFTDLRRESILSEALGKSAEAKQALSLNMANGRLNLQFRRECVNLYNIVIPVRAQVLSGYFVFSPAPNVRRTIRSEIEGYCSKESKKLQYRIVEAAANQRCSKVHAIDIRMPFNNRVKYMYRVDGEGHQSPWLKPGSSRARRQRKDFEREVRDLRAGFCKEARAAQQKLFTAAADSIKR